MRILGIESSCDELACAVLHEDGDRLLSNVIHSQVDLHAQFGGIVPEVASRDHVRRLTAVTQEALDRADTPLSRLEGIAVTSGPGLIGSLLCGVEFAKGLAVATGLPLLGVHHLEGHLAAAFLEDPAPEVPFIALLVSGGHTSLIHVDELGGTYRHLGSTRDDAAGEAFDKTAKLLGLGYPGGAKIDRAAADGTRGRFQFPQMMPGKDNLDFSFSGLKTASANLIRNHDRAFEGQELADFCADFQEAIVDNLLKKAFRACHREKVPRLVLAGGVAANGRLREKAIAKGRREQVRVFVPTRANCTDNAGMIARAGWVRLRRGERSDLDLRAQASWPLFGNARS